MKEERNKEGLVHICQTEKWQASLGRGGSRKKTYFCLYLPSLGVLYDPEKECALCKVGLYCNRGHHRRGNRDDGRTEDFFLGVLEIGL